MKKNDKKIKTWCIIKKMFFCFFCFFVFFFFCFFRFFSFFGLASIHMSESGGHKVLQVILQPILHPILQLILQAFLQVILQAIAPFCSTQHLATFSYIEPHLATLRRPSCHFCTQLAHGFNSLPSFLLFTRIAVIHIKDTLLLVN